MMRKLIAAVAIASATVLAGPALNADAAFSYTQCRSVTGTAGATTLCVTVHPEGTANADGSATVIVDVTCTSTAPNEVYYGNVRVWQDVVGPAAKTDQILVGSPTSPIACDGTTDTYPITTRPRGYHPGSARVIAVFSAQGSGGLTTVQVDTGDYQTNPPVPGVTLI